MADSYDYSKYPGVVYRASSLGGCTKSLVAGRLGYSPIPIGGVEIKTKKDKPKRVFQDAFDEGRRLEDVAIRRAELEVIDREREVAIEVMPGVWVVGHIDGITPYNRQLPILELKSMGDNYYRQVEASDWDTPGLMQKYKWQLSSYMLALNRPALVICINSDPSFSDIDRPYFKLQVGQPFYSLDDIRARVMDAEGWARAGELPPTCDRPQFPCPFWYLHEDEEVVGVDDGTVRDLALSYKQAQLESKVAKEKEGEFRKALEGLREKGEVSTKTKTLDSGERLELQSRKVKGDWGGVTWYEQADNPSIDYDMMKRDGVDIGKYKRVKGKGWRMRVTVKDRDKGENDG